MPHGRRNALRHRGYRARVDAFDWSRAVELSDVVSGRAVGRSRPESIALFKSVGMAIEDVALGAQLVKLARVAGIGSELPL